MSVKGLTAIIVILLVVFDGVALSQQISENGVVLTRRNETFFSGQGNRVDKLCRYVRDQQALRELQWIHNGVVLARAQSGTQVLLVLENIDLGHNGEYSCRALLSDDTVVGPVSAGFINVIDSSQLFVQPEHYVLEGDDVTLQCSSSNPEIVTFWRSPSGNSNTNNVIRNAQVERELSGEYRYECVFLLGSVSTSQQTEVIVIVPPRLNLTTPTPLEAISGTPHSLTASFRSRTVNTTTVTWNRLDGSTPSGAIITEFTDIKRGFGTTSINFNSVSKADSGHYQVTVSNSHQTVPDEMDNVSSVIELIVRVLPAVPDPLIATPINSTHYNISWTLTHETNDQQATTLLLNVTQPSRRVIQVPSSLSEQYILEVEPGQTYELSLIASNNDGSVTTQPTAFSTQPDAPLIRSVSVQRLNTTTIDVTLDLFYTGGGDITSITLSTGSQEFSVGDLKTTDSEVWTGTVVDREVERLVFSSDLQFTVEVMNERSLKRTVSTQQTFIIPTAPLVEMDTVTETVIKLNIQLPVRATEPISSVIVEISNFELSQLVRTANETGPFSRGETVMVTISIKDLQPGIIHSAVVYCTNAGGEGQRSRPLNFTTVGVSLPLSVSALIGICIVGSVIATIALVLAIICFFICLRQYRRRRGERYCTADYKNEPRQLDVGDVISGKNGNAYSSHHLNREGALTPRSPVISSRASSDLPPTGTDYSYEDSEIEAVITSTILHKRQNDFMESKPSHFLYRHSPPTPLQITPLPLDGSQEHILSPSSLILSDDDIGSPPNTALSYATDV